MFSECRALALTGLAVKPKMPLWPIKPINSGPTVHGNGFNDNYSHLLAGFYSKTIHLLPPLLAHPQLDLLFGFVANYAQ